MSEFVGELTAFSNSIERELERGELSFPTVLDLSRRIRKMVDDPNSSISDIAGLVRIEPVLSARVVRMANSVVFNPSGHNTATVNDAIQRIGLANVRATALAVAINQLSQDQRSKTMQTMAREVWRHSVDVAAWAYAVSRHLKVGNPETALLAGMMVDIGQLFLIARVGKYPLVAADAAGFEAMSEFWSAALTRAVLESMGLPADVLDALDFSDPYAGGWPPRTMNDALYVAGMAAEMNRPAGASVSGYRRRRFESARAALDQSGMDELLSEAQTVRDELLAVFAG